MLAAIVISLYLLFAVYVYRIFRKRPAQDDTSAPDYDAAQVEDEVTCLYEDMRKLRELDELMIDLRLCSPDEMQRSFRMEWQSVGGQNHRFDFWADGASQSTEHLMRLAQTEREALNETITRRISGLYFRANSLDAVCKTSAKRLKEGREHAYN